MFAYCSWPELLSGLRLEISLEKNSHRFFSNADTDTQVLMGRSTVGGTVVSLSTTYCFKAAHVFPPKTEPLVSCCLLDDRYFRIRAKCQD